MTRQINQSCNLIIFGAKGDLAKRKLFPALYKLEKYNNIHQNTRIIGAGRANWSKKDYQSVMKIAIKQFLHEKIDEKIWNVLSSRLDFCNIDVNDQSSFLQLRNMYNTNKNMMIYYCAMPPNTFYYICKGLGYANLNTIPSRIVIEKPLGICLETSKKINDQIAKYFLESQIFRIDHYLGKEPILNLLALRFANSLLFHNWNHDIIDHVQITVSEQVGIENRWNYFDHMGQMRDMIQNHLLQILTIIAMSPPKNLTAESIQQEKVKILRSLHPINTSNININTARGQYTSGFINGHCVPGYREEHGANENTLTETFVAIKVDINNDQWRGVPFYLRTGKRLAHKYSEIIICFKKIDTNIFTHSHIERFQNQLTIRLEPESNIKINILHKKPGLDSEYYLQKNELICNYLNNNNSIYSIDAYERLLLESMRGKQSLFVCRNEIEAAWKWVDPIFSTWQKDKKNTIEFYSAGTWGPKNSDLIMSRDNRAWYAFN